ncbi:MAG: hypothetical protein K1X65_00635 [Caldilineales bacterium]|nr:hypothetical protein [Caldilineales bacterium]
MTANWTLILNWIIQGLILGGFALAGVYLALRLFAGQRNPPPAPPLARTEAPPVVAAPASSPARPTTPARPTDGRPPTGVHDPDAVRHAFEFGDDDRLTMIVEVPAAYLADDGALVEVWVDAVGWARLEQNQQAGKKTKNGPPPAAAPAAAPEHLQSHLDQVLQRLQLSADRRGQLRAMLDQNLPAGQPEP